MGIQKGKRNVAINLSLLYWNVLFLQKKKTKTIEGSNIAVENISTRKIKKTIWDIENY